MSSKKHASNAIGNRWQFQRLAQVSCQTLAWWGGGGSASRSCYKTPSLQSNREHIPKRSIGHCKPTPSDPLHERASRTKQSISLPSLSCGMGGSLCRPAKHVGEFGHRHTGLESIT